LNAQSIAHRFVHIDLVPLETKNRVKEALFAKFKEHVSFPYAIIDGEQTLVGFIEEDWKKTLL